MYLLDTNIISETRRGNKANKGVVDFFNSKKNQSRLSVVTIGEVHRGIERLKHHNDIEQANRLETWLEKLLHEYNNAILPISLDVAQVWGKLCGISPHHAVDKLLAATALIYDLTLVTRNTADFIGMGVRLLNPFELCH